MQYTQKPKIVFIDCETEGLNPYRHKCHGLGIAFEEDSYAYYLIEEVPEHVRDLLKDPEVAVCGHNLNFDKLFLAVNGFEINGPLADTKLMCQLCDENEPTGLKYQAEKCIGAWSLKNYNIITRWLSSNGFKEWEYIQAPFELVSNYCMEDVQNTCKLFYIKHKRLAQIDEQVKEAGFDLGPIDYYREEMQPCEDVLLLMKHRGIKVNMSEAKQHSVTVANTIKEVEDKLTTLCSKEIEPIIESKYQKELDKRVTDAGKAKVKRPEFNWSSTQDVSKIFFDQMKAPVYKRTPKGKPSLRSQDVEIYSQSDNKRLAEVASLYDEYKKLSKLITTYLENLPKFIESDGKIHADFAHKTVTGRLASSSPNMQNLPKNKMIKQLYVPDEGKVFVYADYSQLELRVAAHVSGDPLLIKAFNSGADLHQETSDFLDIDRKKAKNINFGIIYGVYPRRICELLGWDKEAKMKDAWDLREDLLNRFGGIKKHLNNVEETAQKYQAVVSMFGRVRRLPDATSEDKFTRFRALRQAINFVIQSPAASIAKRAMVDLEEEGFPVLLQVHDSILIEVPIEEAVQAEARMREIMCNVVKLAVPLTVETQIIKSFDEEDLAFHSKSEMKRIVTMKGGSYE